jgi:hypothetical protein
MDTKSIPIIVLVSFPRVSCDNCEGELNTEGNTYWGRILEVNPKTLQIKSFELHQGIPCPHCGKNIASININEPEWDHPEYRMN